jgi:hypothetical protein
MFNGYAANSFRLAAEPKPNHVALFRPTSDVHNLIAGWVEKSKNSDKVHKGGSIMVSTDGEGSHTFSYVTPIDFIPNSNTAVLKPKIPMPLSFQLFIAVAITNERWRYSYGRKPKGDRLQNLLLKIPVLKDGEPDVQAFESMVNSIPEYHYVLAYFNSLTGSLFLPR